MLIARTWNSHTVVHIHVFRARNHLQLFIVSVYLAESRYSCETHTKSILYGLHNLCRWNSKKDPTQYTRTPTPDTSSKHSTAHMHRYYFQHGFGFIFHALRRVVSIIFHTFYFDYYSYLYIRRIVYSHTVPVLFHSFCSHTVLGFVVHSGFADEKVVCERVSEWVFECLHTHSRDMILN